MIKSILYGGVSTSPNELICKDGELAVTNAIASISGGLSAEGEVSSILTLPSGYKILFLHKQPQYENAIYYIEDTTSGTTHGRMRFYRKNMETNTFVTPAVATDDIGLDLSAEPLSITAVGNTLCIATTEGLRYAIFKDLTSYNLLPTEFPQIKFQCGLRGQMVSQKYSGYVKYNDDQEEKSESYSVLIETKAVSASANSVVLGEGKLAANTPYYIQINVRSEHKALYYKRVITYSDGYSQEHSASFYTDEIKEHYVKTFDNHGTPTKVTIIIAQIGANGNFLDEFTGSLSGNIALYTTEQSALFTDESYTAIRGGINWFKKVHAYDKKKFMHPFFVRLALRLYDGTYVSLSAPMLMLPSTCTSPIVRLYNSGEETNKKYFMNYSAMVCDLYLNIYNTYSEFVPYKDIITDIVLAISKPIDNYDSSVEDIHNMREQYLKTDYPILDTNTGFSVCSLDNNDSNLEDFKKQYIKTLLDSYTPISSTGTKQIQLPTRDASECLEETSSFYIVENISLDEIESGKYDSYEKVDFSKVNFENLVNRQVLTDNTSVLNKYTPQTLFAYNNRLHIADYKEEIFKGYPLSTLNGSIGLRYDGSALTMVEYRCIVEVHQDGQTFEVEVPFNSGDYIEQINLPTIVGLRDDYSSVHWFYYPSPYAKKATIYIKSKQFSTQYYTKIELTLKPHPYLNGAYWFDSFNDICSAKRINYSPSSQEYSNIEKMIKNGYTHLQGVIAKDNYLRLANASNPFIFDSARVYRFDSEVLGLSSAVTALSVGQKGQFDLYIFTRYDGVWSLKVNDEGSYTRQVPDTRDCVIYAKSITQIDDSVLFATSRGIMEIRGSRSKCISDTLEQKLTSDTESLTGASELGLTSLTSDFKTYISECEIIYDYKGQEIVVFNKNYQYMYVFSLRTGLWNVTGSTYIYAINSYPDALAVRINSNFTSDVVNLSDRVGDAETLQTGTLVTRALKLGDYNSFKRITALRQDGVFCTATTMSQVLYGSNDLVNWKAIASSTSSRIAFIEGGVYRFFKLALKASLSDEDVLVGFTINYEIVDNNENLY